MSSPTASTWSATDPMALSLTPQKAHLSPNPTERVLSAAQRYYAQPRVGNLSSFAILPTCHTWISLTDANDRAKESQPLGGEAEPKHGGNGEDETPKKHLRTSRKRKRARSNSTRQSPRLIRDKTAALERMLRERLDGDYLPPVIKTRKNARRESVNSMSDIPPAMSEDPTSYNSSAEDCRFHLPQTIEDRLAVRAALTPTLFRLQKKGWCGSVVWNPDASYMEALQKCLHEFYKFELTKKAELSPFNLGFVLMLLPWYGKISDFRNSPNWPEGW